VAVEPFHLARYIDEQSFRYNNCIDQSGTELKDAERFELALSQTAGKQLTFAEFTRNAEKNNAWRGKRGKKPYVSSSVAFVSECGTNKIF
jgi:hypothetical protein